MTYLNSVLGKAAAPETPDADDPNVNWRSRLGLFWRDLKGIDDVIEGNRVQHLEARVERLENELRRLTAENAELRGAKQVREINQARN